jgi:hypothetical protein
MIVGPMLDASELFKKPKCYKICDSQSLFNEQRKAQKSSLIKPIMKKGRQKT